MDAQQSHGSLSYLQNYLEPTSISAYNNKNYAKKHENIFSDEENLLKIYTKNLKNQNYKNNNNKVIQNRKMAPISEKRSPIIKENTKENIASSPTIKNSNQNGRGPEILDFRESWLQEIELYKDHVKAQQLLTAHNHLHTIDGCQSNSSTPTGKSNESSKRRARTKSDSDNTDIKTKNFKDYEDGLVLKRAREDNIDYTNINQINGKDTETDNSVITMANSNFSYKPITTSTAAVSNISEIDSHSFASSAINNHQKTNGQTESTTTTPKNIIVNPYHLSLLNTQETDKNKIIINSVKNNNVLLQINVNIDGNSTAVTSPNTEKVASNHSPAKNQRPQSPNKLKSLSTTTSRTMSPSGKNNGFNGSNSNNINSIKQNTNQANNVPASKPTPIDNSIPIDDVFIETVNLANSSNPAANNVHNTNDLVNDDDDATSYYDDDDCFGDIENADYIESSDESDEEYVGCTYYLDSDEENLESTLGTNDQCKQMLSMASTKIDESINTNEITSSNPVQYITPKSIFTPSLFPLVPPYLSFSSHAEKGPTPPPELQKILKWRLSAVMPKVVRRVVANSGFRLIKKTNDWMASWEKHMRSPCFKAIKSHQKFNHLPGTFKIGRKDSVWRNIRTFISKHGKKEFGFMQKSFVLPQDLDMLKKVWPKQVKKGTKWIIKPPASARGTGIKVVSRWTEFPKQKPLIVQKYIERPLLINGNKFDLRLYVIVTSINPLRIYMHTDGLARFASVQYSDNLDTLKDRCMHLTNYSINKFSSNYSKNEDINACQGHKWTLKSLWTYFRQRGINTTKLWGTLRNLVIKTVIGGESCLNRMYKTNVGSRYNCYELFGFDVLLDENLVPWLLEVNISPSLHSDLPLDQHVKGPLIQAVLNSALYQVPPKLNCQHEQSVKNKYNIKGPLCFDKRIFTTCLSQPEIRKHNEYTSSDIIEYREEYLDSILDELTPDDIRCLIITEDELARSSPLERIFPSQNSYKFLKFLEGPRYYNRLVDAWESKYGGKNRPEGISILQKLCEKGIHLQVPDAALVKEANIEGDIFELNAFYKLQSKTDKSSGTASPEPTKNSTIKNMAEPSMTAATNSHQQNCSQEVKTHENSSVANNAPISVEVK